MRDREVSPVLCTINSKTHVHILAIVQHISQAVLTVHHRKVPTWVLEPLFSNPFLDPGKRRTRVTQFLEPTLILFFGVFLVEDVILLITPKPYTPKAVLATDAVDAKVTLCAVHTVLTEPATVGIHAKETLITELDMHVPVHVHAVRSPILDEAVIAITGIIHAKAHGAIFVIHRVMCVLAVLVLTCPEGDLGNFKEEIIPLFKKWPVEIKLTPIVHWIPFVPPPLMLIEDNVWLIGGID